MNDKLVELLAKVFDVKKSMITQSLQQKEVAKWDSLTHMDLISSIESTYQIELSMEDIIEMTSVSHILTVLKKHKVDFYA